MQKGNDEIDLTSFLTYKSTLNPDQYFDKTRIERIKIFW
jgi:hypothetical protein